MTDVDLVLVGGRVRTLDPVRPSASAIAVDAGRIVAVGDDASVRALGGPATEVVELDGAAVVPGLTDSHMHPFSGATWALGADLLDAHTLEDVRAGLAAERARCAPGEWVRGWGLDYNVFADQGISASLIDDVVADAPAAITFMDVHTILASSAGLAAAGIDGPRRFDEHAEVVCVDGSPTGELRENAAMDLVRHVMPRLTQAERHARCAEHLRRLAAVGLTATHAMDGTLETHELLSELESRGELVTRILTPFTIEPETPEGMWERFAAAGGAHGRRWRGGVAKFFIDGVIDSGTAWLFEPDTLGEGLVPFWPDVERYRRAVAFFAGHGFQCVTHAIGDRAIHEALDAYAAVGASPALARVRHRIEHVETIAPEDLPRFAAEGVIASMQPQHMIGLAPDRSDNWSRRLGDARCDRGFRTRALLQSGACVPFGSDWPVARYDPRLGMAAARLRRPPGEVSREPYDDQALNGLAALHGYTTAPAYAAGEEDERGRLTVGRLADVTVFAEDPVEVDPDALPGLEVLLTVVDGEIVYRA